VDGYSHRFKQKEDRVRDKRLVELGYKTIRFIEGQVRDDLKNVISELEGHLNLTNDDY
jgi:very-short-patch-repair endonuclease